MSTKFSFFNSKISYSSFSFTILMKALQICRTFSVLKQININLQNFLNYPYIYNKLLSFIVSLHELPTTSGNYQNRSMRRISVYSQIKKKTFGNSKI